jgi:pimeloyl-ACP methyl ester carboxylesterase
MVLAQHWSLIVPTRRGAPRSEEVRRLMTNRTHLVGFADGSLAAAQAAEQDPEMVRSLTLIEPPADFATPPNAGIPMMVVSGGHDEGVEARCDALARRLHARREVVPAEGEEVPRAPGFNDVLEDFLRGSAGTARSRTA